LVAVVLRAAGCLRRTPDRNGHSPPRAAAAGRRALRDLASAHPPDGPCLAERALAAGRVALAASRRQGARADTTTHRRLVAAARDRGGHDALPGGHGGGHGHSDDRAR
jgi:hypothetical protein